MELARQGRCVYLCYKINGYWFRLNLNQWSKYRKISKGTIYYRNRMKKTSGQILGFDVIEQKSKIIKPEFKPKNKDRDTPRNILYQHWTEVTNEETN